MTTKIIGLADFSSKEPGKPQLKFCFQIFIIAHDYRMNPAVSPQKGIPNIFQFLIKGQGHVVHRPKEHEEISFAVNYEYDLIFIHKSHIRTPDSFIKGLSWCAAVRRTCVDFIE